MSHKSTTYQHIDFRPILIIVLAFICVEISAQKHSVHQLDSRKPVDINCDTALTSDLRKVHRPYRFSDNLFWGASTHGSYIIHEVNHNPDFWSMVNYGAEFTLGKYFTPWISASLNLDYTFQHENLAVAKRYSYHSSAVIADLQLCLNRLFSRYKPYEKFIAYGVVGAGYQSAFAFDVPESAIHTVNTGFQASPLYRAGILAEWRVTESTSVSLQGLWNTDTKSLCGKSDNFSHSSIQCSVGFICRLPNHYASRAFQNCRGNEIYYFKILEDRLLKDHQQQQRQYLKGKAEAPIMAAEQDSILIFPCGYPYLTLRQEAKLNKAAAQMSAVPQLKLVIDLYPIVSDDPKMTPSQSVQRCEIAIRSYLTKHSQNPIDATRIQFRQHPDQQSPIANQSIWIHGAVLHYQQ